MTYFEDDLSEVRKGVRQAMDYAVPEDCRDEAEELLEIYRDDRIGLDILNAFYTALPETGDVYVREILVVARQRGIFLLCAMTGLESGYLYLVSSEGIEFQGNLQEGFLDQELIDYFQYEDKEAFKDVCSQPDKLPVYEPLQVDEDICPACHVYSGEYHELGCPVEVCPWCGGQMVNCSCRFDQLGLDEISTEEELIRFESMLEERGRIPYSREQRPSFADEGPGVLLD